MIAKASILLVSGTSALVSRCDMFLMREPRNSSESEQLTGSTTEIAEGSNVSHVHHLTSLNQLTSTGHSCIRWSWFRPGSCP